MLYGTTYKVARTRVHACKLSSAASVEFFPL